MKQPFYIFIILITALLYGCARKPVYTCGFGYLSNKPKIHSKVIKLKRTGIADTTVAFISGQIFGKDSIDKGITIDTLEYANVYVVDNVTGKVIGKATDLNGKFDFTVPSATYDLNVQYAAYNTLIIRNVFFGTGDVLELNAVLGQSGTADDSSEYKILNEWTIEEIK